MRRYNDLIPSELDAPKMSLAMVLASLVGGLNVAGALVTLAMAG